MNKKIILVGILSIYLIIVFDTEILYRNSLYDFSVKYIEKIEQKGFFHKFYYFWSMIFLYVSLIIGMYVSLFFYSINISYSHISVQLIMLFIMCLLKSVYANSRPYWDIYLLNQKNETEKILPTPTECDPEFGNPSGHAFLSIYLLILWDLFINSKFISEMEGKKKIFIKYITLILSLLCIGFISYSRINRQVHSFNQIMFGLLLGFALFFAFCYILELNKVDANIFIEVLDKYKFILLPIFILFFAISVLLGLTRHNEKEEKYQKILELYCDMANKWEMFGKITAVASSTLFVPIGGYLGLLFLKFKINKNYSGKESLFYNWYKAKTFQKLKIGCFNIFLPAIASIPIIFISNKYYVIKFVLIALFCLFYGFCLFGFTFYFACVLFKLPEIVQDNILENSENKEIQVNDSENNANNENNSESL